MEKEREIRLLPLRRHEHEKADAILIAFSKEDFTLDKLISNLPKYEDEPGVIDFLVNKLFTYTDKEIDFYIPQLCYVVLKHNMSLVEVFLKEKAKGNVAFFLKVQWCIQAFGEANRKYPHKFPKVEALESALEVSMVNGSSEKFNSRLRNKNTKPSEINDIMMEMILEKEIRSNYLSTVNKFINYLVRVSSALKSSELSQRKKKLKEYLVKANKWVDRARALSYEKKYEKSEIKNYLFGIIFPFSYEEDSTTNSNLIVRILETEYTCFSTKKRVPYKIVFETLDYRDLSNLSNEELKSLLETNNNNSLLLKHGGSTPANSQGEWETEENIIEKDTSETPEKINKYENLKTFVEKISQDEGNPMHDLDEDKRNSDERVSDIQEDLMKSENIYKKFVNRESKVQKVPRITNINANRNLGDSERIPEEDEEDKEKRQPNELDLGPILISEAVKKMILNPISQEGAEKEEKEEGKQEEQLDQEATEKEFKPRVFSVWEELWEDKQVIIKKSSPFGHFPSYKLRSVIVKGGDDLRQEIITMQIIRKIQEIWKKAGLNLFLRTYDIIVTSEDSGILEFISDSISIDGMKKKLGENFKSLSSFYHETFDFSFEEAQKNFVESLAGYSLLCYVLQIKDRHNGNILIDADGHLVHIDFGFILGLSPGNINFENAHFKFTKEYLELIGGKKSDMFMYLKTLMFKGFLELRKHVETFVQILDTMRFESDISCFSTLDMNAFRGRFKEHYDEVECMKFINKLLSESIDNWRTK